MGFIDDVSAQPAVLRELVSAYRGTLAADLDRAAGLVAAAQDQPLVVTGMGSSLSAGRTLDRSTRQVILEDAGELLHYGIGAAAAAGAVIAVSQSGRSYETVAVVERLRALGAQAPVIAVCNDPASPLAGMADVALPMLAGTEANVATKTYVAAIAVLLMLQRGACDAALASDLLAAAAEMERLNASDAAGEVCRRMAGCRAVVFVGRGPGLGAAAYAALTSKESAAIPTEALAGGAFRHGPMELAGPGAGIVVVAPDGPTSGLATSLAVETAELGSPTWLIGGGVADAGVALPDGLHHTPLAPLPEALAALAAVVPLQHLAAGLARFVGREPGRTLVASKVTDRE